MRLSKEELINSYTGIWLKKDANLIKKVFAKDIRYTEFMGNVYIGLEQCLHWFRDWSKVGRVLKWDILSQYDIGNTIIVEWYFESEYEKNTDGFNGVSVIKINNQGLIGSVREYYAKSELTYPYGRINS